MSNFVAEPARQVPVVEDCDLCVIGGSTTGVFAAVAAARLGLRCCVVEALGLFGGTATASLVCIWHSMLDARHGQIIYADGRREQAAGASRCRSIRRSTRSPIAASCRKAR